MKTPTDDLLLGKHMDYPREYSPNVLQPISRAISRESLPFGLNVGRGFDCWHLYELSWLDDKGKPHVAIGRVMVPADSPNIVESKSFKLYCNSLNFTQVQSPDVLAAIIKRDIGHVVKAAVSVELFEVDALPLSRLRGTSIDDASLTVSQDAVKALVAMDNRKKLLQFENDEKVSEILYSHLLRSNCPVTNQPDWGSLLVRYEGKTIRQSALLTYLCSFREHNGFHEQCVEQIFADIWTTLKPTKLLVQAWYTRRGGIDINPCRVSESDWLPDASRLVRQ